MLLVDSDDAPVDSARVANSDLHWPKLLEDQCLRAALETSLLPVEVMLNGELVGNSFAGHCLHISCSTPSEAVDGILPL